MHTIQTARPQPALREFVRSYAQREMTHAATGFELPFIASIEPILSFNFYDRESIQNAGGQRQLVSRLHVLGPQTYPSRIAHFNGYTLAFGIFLKPLALWKLFRIPSLVFTDTDMAGEDLLGKGFQTLWERLAESETFAARISVAEQYLLPFALNVVDRTCIMKSAEHIFSHNGATRIDVLANHAALSVRQFERRFTEEIGISPKLFARITRFQVALDAKRLTPSNSWLSIAHEFGYHDQMHMIRDFRSLGGDAPGIVIQQTGDLQPWSLASTTPLALDRFGKLKVDLSRKTRTMSQIHGAW